MRSSSQNIVFVGASLLLTTFAFADGAGLGKGIQSASIDFDYQFAVLKSNTVAGTDFGDSSRIGVSAYTGKERELGLALTRDQTSTKFSQIDSSMQTQWTDFAINYRFWWFTPSIILGSCAIAASGPTGSLTDAICLTTGAGLKGQYAAGAKAIAYLDSRFVSATKVRDLAGSNVKIGMRTDIDFGVTLRVFLLLDVMTGYRLRLFDVSIDGTNKSEVQTGPYAGLKIGATF